VPIHNIRGYCFFYEQFPIGNANIFMSHLGEERGELRGDTKFSDFNEIKVADVKINSENRMFSKYSNRIVFAWLHLKIYNGKLVLLFLCWFVLY